MDNDTVTEKKLKGRFTLLLLLSVFIAPLAVALLWQPTGFVNHGDLIQPARVLEEVQLETLTGEPFLLSELNGKWTLLYVGAGECTEVCRQNLYNMRQVRLAQGKNTHRVAYGWIVNDSVMPETSLLQDHPKIRVLKGPPEAIGKIVEQFEQGVNNSVEVNRRIFLVDPIGNLMMSFAADFDPRLMLKDLKRLLKVSRLGNRTE